MTLNISADLSSLFTWNTKQVMCIWGSSFPFPSVFTVSVQFLNFSLLESIVSACTRSRIYWKLKSNGNTNPQAQEVLVSLVSKIK
jgi:hypothetical protein